MSVVRFDCLTGAGWLTVALVLAGGGPALAADVLVTKSIGSTVEVTDNVDLEPDEDKQASIVTRIGPAATVSVDGNRLDLLFAGSLGLLHFSHDNSFQIDQNLRGVANAELWEDWLYLDLSGSSTRQLVDQQSRVSAADSARGDRESVTVLSASPYLAHSFGNWAVGELRYRRTQTFSQTTDSTQDEQRFELATGTRFTRTRGAVLLEHITDESESENPAGDDEFERTTGQLSGQYALWRRFSVTGVAGYDEIDTESSRDLSGPFYQFGIDTRPGPRTEFALAIGQRYDGLWVTGDFGYEITERLILTGEINRVLETTTDRLSDRRRGEVVDPITGELVTEDLDEDAEEGVAVTWRGNLGLQGLYGRNTYDLNFIYVEREFETTSDTTYGLRGAWTRELSRRWSSRLSGFANQSDDEDRNNTTVGARAALDYEIYQNAVLSFGVSRTQRFSEEEGDEYTENTAFVTGRLRF